MKQIIDGKRYNTETATEIAHFWNGRSSSDFSHVSETLYRTSKGTYFIYGEGGPMTKYAQPVGDMTGGGEAITPMTPEQARSWLENHGETEALETYFPGDIEDA